MSEVSIRRGRGFRALHERADTERLSVIGFVAAKGPHNSFPSPLLTLGGQLIKKYYQDMDRTYIQAIIPAHWYRGGTRFVGDSWAGMVDIKGREPHGFGTVLLNNDTWVYSYVMKDMVPFDQAKELALVTSYDESSVIDLTRLDAFGNRWLAYDTPDKLARLGMLHYKD